MAEFIFQQIVSPFWLGWQTSLSKLQQYPVGQGLWWLHSKPGNFVVVVGWFPQLSTEHPKASWMQIFKFQQQHWSFGQSASEKHWLSVDFSEMIQHS